MRKTALSMVTELAENDGRICFIGSDLGAGAMDDFGAKYPDRLFREGISEQHVIGMAAGLALEGHVVYVNTIASFLTRRCLEQIHLDLCLTKAKVRLIGSGGGVVYAPLGPTHLACDDIGLMRLQPGMTVLAPCDAHEMRRLMPQTVDVDGPVYIRLAKGGDRIVSQDNRPVTLGKPVVLHDTDSVAPVLFITTGIMAQVALDAAALLENEAVACRVLHCHTLAPLDSEELCAQIVAAGRVVTVEEHIRTGGLGAAVAELCADAGIQRPLRRVALPDVFFHEHGSQNQILQRYGLDAGSLARCALDR